MQANGLVVMEEVEVDVQGFEQKGQTVVLCAIDGEFRRWAGVLVPMPLSGWCPCHYLAGAQAQYGTGAHVISWLVPRPIWD